MSENSSRLAKIRLIQNVKCPGCINNSVNTCQYINQVFYDQSLKKRLCPADPRDVEHLTKYQEAV